MNLRDAANATATRLAAVGYATGYYGQVGRALPGSEATTPTDPPVKTPGTDLRVRPYFVYWPGAGGQGPDLAFCGDDVGQDGGFTITAVAGDVEDLLALVARIDATIVGWTPDSRTVGRIRKQPGAQRPMLLDRDVTPARHFVRLPYARTI